MTHSTQDTQNIQFLAKLDGRNKQAIKWSCMLNGQLFEYSEGIGHFLNIPHVSWKHPERVYESVAQELINKSVGVDIGKGRTITATDRIKASKGWTDQLRIIKILPPQLDDVLYALVMDSEALEMCFEDWADNYGYDSDSISAQKIYQACVDNGHKLRKAGININAQRERLQEMGY